MSSTFSAQSYFESLVTILDINGLAEVEENDSNDSLACDDNAHKVIICAHSLILCVQLLEVNGLSEVDENNSQDTLANDDDAHKVVLCALSLILGDQLLFRT